MNSRFDTILLYQFINIEFGVATVHDYANLYSEDFFKVLIERTLPGANKILSYVIERQKPNSILDVGCGVGVFLSVAKNKGVQDIIGIDGDYIQRGQLLIPDECFLPADLEYSFDMGRRFDLTISLEVAEHLTEDAAATFIESLCKHSDYILFSAAIPGQGGPGHVNEQWPSYWQKLFLNQNFIARDCIRLVNDIWNDENLTFYHRNNPLLYVQSDRFDESLKIFPEIDYPLDIVHPAMYSLKASL